MKCLFDSSPWLKTKGLSIIHYGKLKIKCRISPKARFPKKNASEKIWKKFNDKFCKVEMKFTEENRDRLMKDYPNGGQMD